MTLKSLTIIALVAASFATAPDMGQAQSGIQDLPVNFPPASYTGRQFVDNNGCVFVRAGFDGAVTWVPRVSRQRKQICGQTPTFAAPRAAEAEPPAAVEPAPAVAIAAPAVAPPAAPVAVQAAPQRRVVSEPLPRSVATTTTTTTPRVVRQAPQSRVVSTAPVTIKVPASKPVAAPPPRVVRKVSAPVATVSTTPPLPAGARIVTARSMGAAACQRATGTVTRIVNGKTLTVRCGPQETAHVTVIRRGEAPSAGKKVYHNTGWQSPSSLSGHTRIVPRHVYEQRSEQVPMVPHGYRPAWSDDRLNRYRAVQTVDGYKATQQVWTNTVPRELVSSTGKPAEIKEPVIAYRATGKLAPVVSAQGGAALVQKAPVVSTKSAPRKPATGARWVEIGVFTTQDKAQAAARRLQAAGLPVKFGVFRKNGTEYRRVLVGPYASEASVTSALSSVRRVGYSSAYLR